MDKVKIFLAVLKKHHFWVLVGLVLVLGLTIYMTAAADLQGRFQTRSKKLIAAEEQARQIARDSEHPNEQKIKNWELVKDSQKQRVFDGWKALYDKQQKENPWPAKLGKPFIDLVTKELKPDEEIPPRYRDIYMTFIESELDPLLDIVEYRHYEPIEVKPGEQPSTPGAMGGASGVGAMGGIGGMGGMMGMEGLGGTVGQNVKVVGTVDWNPQDLQRIKAGFFFPIRPSSTRVRLAQEDYWVYQALLNIIRKTNGDASTHSAVAVKQINAMQIGQAAASAIGMAGSAAFGGSGMGMGMGMGGEGAGMGMGMGGEGAGMGMGAGAMPPGGAAPGMEPGAGVMQGAGTGLDMGMPGGGMGDGMGMGMGGAAAGAASIDDVFLNYRYVDQNYTPLPAGTDPPYREFKMMPVYLNLIIDQRKIPDLLVECANSTMPVEIKKVRINPGAGGALGMGGMGRGMDGMAGPGMAGSGMAGPGMMGPGMAGPGMGGPGMAGPGMMGPGMAGPGMAGPGMAGPGMMGPGMAGPGMMGPGRAGPGMAGPGMAGPGMAGPGMAGPGMMGPGMESGMGGMGGVGGMGATNEDVNPYEVVIELCGIIYIYNPPNLQELATGAVSEKTVEDATNAAMGAAAAQPGEPGAAATGAPPAGTGALPAEAPETPTPPAGAPPAGVTPTGVPPTGIPPTGVPPAAAPPAGVPPAGVPPASGPAPAAPASPAAPAAAPPPKG